MPRKLLIVEDNQDNRELAIKVLKNKGYEIIEAVDGEEAIEKAISEKPDLILLDISLPKLDGYEVAKRLKSMEEFQEIPIVAFTAHAMKGDREKVIAGGFEGYISKPINVREFPDQIMLYLRGKRESVLGGEEKQDIDC
ncbi:MAG: response regulator [Nitrospirales bacterium]|jgi:two-component system cell cycle response regulator DivK|nr:MAG: response regulator [Nitrospirales bacterium]